MSESYQVERIKDFFCGNICGYELSEDEIIQDFENYLDNGGSIDFNFEQKDSHGRYFLGTILHASAERGYGRVVEYVLSRRANVAIEKISETSESRYGTALDISAEKYNTNEVSSSLATFKTLKNRTLQMYSSYGLTPFHLDCSIHLKYWDDEARSRLQTVDVNAAVSAESPFWPGTTPILIAARHKNLDLVKRLLDLGADPMVRDLGNNTPLHYLPPFLIYDERLFAADGKNTFGSFTGESHFHIACRQSPRSLEIVKRYLDQGISPDLPMQPNPCNADQVGLHLATCPQLVQLLLEYGAETDKKDSDGFTPIELYFKRPFYTNWRDYIRSVCLLIEVGSNTKEVDASKFLYIVSTFSDASKRLFLERILRMTTLNANLVSDRLKNVYVEIKNQVASSWNEPAYIVWYSAALQSLSSLGLRHILDDTVIYRPDFDNKLRWLDNSGFGSYLVYGEILRTKTKRKLLELREKRRKISQIVPQLQQLFQSLCHLPHLCAEEILWNFNSKELEQFLIPFSN